MRTLRLGTRGSQLALWQARTVAAAIERTGDARCELVVIKTTGDRLSEANLSQVGGKRLFVKEIEEALLEGTADLAVHSSKDMPAVLPDGLVVAAVLPREDSRDALVMPVQPREAPAEAALDALADHDAQAILARVGGTPRVGTSSVRRVAQLRRALPRATFEPVRGNLDTRLRKLDEGRYDALVLAAAGLKRLGFGMRISAALALEVCVPAPGQGIVAVESRIDDGATRAVLAAIDDPPSMRALIAERAVVEALGGGCHAPIGALAVEQDGALVLTSIVASLDGARLLRHVERGPAADPQALGRRAAAALAEDGADELLEEARRAQGLHDVERQS